MARKRKVVWDTEATGLLDEESIDYTQSPYVLRPEFDMHCAVAKDADTNEKFLFPPKLLKKEFVEFIVEECEVLIAHNQIYYDLMVNKLFLGIDFEITDNWRECFLAGRPIQIVDTLVLSKTLNPDRFGGHSIDAWGERLGLTKIDWRAKAIELGLISWDAPKGAEFKKYHPEMLVYNERDVDVNHLVYNKLLEEWGDWAWDDPFGLEQATADIIARQAHRGFYFDRTLAEENVRDLDKKMEDIKAIVEPVLPPKPMGVTKLKAYLPPKIQFKKSDGSVSAVMVKWVEKHGGELKKDSNGKWNAVLYGKWWPLPMHGDIPIQTHEPATVKDTTHIKQWLVELGWEPTAYKERDLTVDSKKNKLSREKYEAAAERYIEQTLSSPFCNDRCEQLETTPKKLRDKLMRFDHTKRPLKVYTNPTITVGMEKEIDPKLLELADKFPHAKLVSEFLTYSHRRNSILGGGVDPDEIDDDDDWAGKGFISAVRQDGRIPTPADTCGAGTTRMKHRIVANVPRSSSLYGDKMRAMFGTEWWNRMFQLGYDFASLEARIESHYCWRYDDEEHTYCKSLLLEKPNDVHTKTAEKVAQTLSEYFNKEIEFKRTPAKNVKYCCAYGGQPKRVAKTIGSPLEVGQVVYDAYWAAAAPLAGLNERLTKYWETTGQKKFILGLDGRKIPTRSKSALINSLFQSGGVICAKRSMVKYDQLLKERGLAVDFFRDDWRSKIFIQQLIAYHDEAQLEVHGSLIQWKKFETEEEAKEFVAANPKCSSIGHTEKGYYVGFSIAGDLVHEAVEYAGNYYKLYVPLAAEWILGRNWAECH